jgi:hypothetical protein
MSGKGLRIAIEITKAIFPIIREALEKINEAKSASSEGGSKITKEERQEIAIELSLSAVPALHDAILKVIQSEM